MSSFEMYSFGIVAVDKPLKTDMIKVTPIEKLPLGEGLLSEQKKEYKIKMPDHQGIGRDSKVKGDLMIEAKWTAFGQSNRVTAPDVIKGETVMLFKVSDTDEFFWTTLMNEPEIRRLETVCYMYNNIPDGLTAVDKSTSYWVEVSTHEKRVQVHTSNNDGEPFIYDVIIDTGAGVLTIKDNADNKIVINSSASDILIKAGNTITLEAGVITLKADGKVMNVTPIVINTGMETTALISKANPHINCVL